VTERVAERSQDSRADEPARRVVHIPYGVQAAAEWTWRLGLIGLGIFLVLQLASFFQVIVVPFLIAVMITALLAPIVNRLQRAGLHRGLGVLVAILTAFLVVGGLSTLVGTQFATGFSDLASQSREGFRQLQELLAKGPLHLSNQQIQGWIDKGTQQLTGNSDQIVAGALSFTSTAGHVITGAFLAFFSTIFLLYDGRGVWRWLVGLLPAAGRERLDLAGLRGWAALSSYVKATILVAFVDAVGIGAGAAILQLPLAVPIGVLVFLAAFVPIVGALISGAVAVLVALVAQGPVVALIMLAIVIGVQQLESHVLQPLFLGRAVSVHPLGVVLVIAAGILMAGIVGGLFAVPIAAVANTMIRELVHRDVAPEDVGPPIARAADGVDSA
jgi:predicted PurR-regulated permease PerM